jgi:hypothetical protein
MHESEKSEFDIIFIFHLDLVVGNIADRGRRAALFAIFVAQRGSFPIK